MRKKIIVLVVALVVGFSMIAITAFADAPLFSGTLTVSKTLTLTITGIDANTPEVTILATNVANSKDILMDTALAANGTATQTFTNVSGVEYIVKATLKNTDGSDGATLNQIDVKMDTPTPTPTPTPKPVSSSQPNASTGDSGMGLVAIFVLAAAAVGSSAIVAKKVSKK